MRILCFGHPDLEEDRLALEVARGLAVPGARIEFCRSPEAILECGYDLLVILDVAKNLSEPAWVTDLSRLRVPKLVSLHDFDLGYFLKLHEELGDLPPLKILALPQRGDVAAISARAEAMLRSLTPT